jgi:HAE1 family hydrophobic/amphiphilic exporter-1
VGGLAFSQIVTLYVTPVFYTYLDDLQDWLARHTQRAPRAGGASLDHGLAHGD